MILPKELITKIYDYDLTYRENYNKVIHEINKFGKFMYYDYDIGCYYFEFNKYINKRGIFFYLSSSFYYHAIITSLKIQENWNSHL